MSKNTHKSTKIHPAKPATAKEKKDNTAFFTFSSAHTFNKIILFFGAVLLYGWTYQFDYGIDDKLVLSSVINTDTDFAGFLSVFKSWFAGADYRPISILSFWLERFFFGVSSPTISHSMNVLLFGCILIKIYDFIIVAKFYENEKTIKVLALLKQIQLKHQTVLAKSSNLLTNAVSLFFDLL